MVKEINFAIKMLLENLRFSKANIFLNLDSKSQEFHFGNRKSDTSKCTKLLRKIIYKIAPIKTSGVFFAQVRWSKEHFQIFFIKWLALGTPGKTKQERG